MSMKSLGTDLKIQIKNILSPTLFLPKDKIYRKLLKNGNQSKMEDKHTQKANFKVI